MVSADESKNDVKIHNTTSSLRQLSTKQKKEEQSKIV